MKVYIVTWGEYSDYHIIGVFINEDKANAAAKLIDGCVELWDVDLLRLVDPGQDFFVIIMKHNGDCKTHQRSRLDSDNAEPRKPWCSLRTHVDHPYKRKSYWELEWHGYAKSKEHAVKIASDIRRQILAGKTPKGVDMGKNIHEQI